MLGSAITGLRELPFNLVVAVGPGVDPSRFGPQPPHVLMEQYLPHALLLPRCRLVVSQGGAGVMLGALSHGLPQLVIPQGADQFANAQACQRSGAALSLAPEEVSSSTIVAAVTEAPFTVAARAVQAEIGRLPDAKAVLATLTANDVEPALD